MWFFKCLQPTSKQAHTCMHASKTSPFCAHTVWDTQNAYVNPIRSWAFILSCLHHVGWESPFYGSVSSTRPWGLEEKVPGLIFLSTSQGLVQCLEHWESTGWMHVKHRMLKCLNVSVSRLIPDWYHAIFSKLSRLTWSLLFWTSIVLLICIVHLNSYCYMHCLLWQELVYILVYVP